MTTTIWQYMAFTHTHTLVVGTSPLTPMMWCFCCNVFPYTISFLVSIWPIFSLPRRFSWMYNLHDAVKTMGVIATMLTLLATIVIGSTNAVSCLQTHPAQFMTQHCIVFMVNHSLRISLPNFFTQRHTPRHATLCMAPPCNGMLRYASPILASSCTLALIIHLYCRAF